MKKLFLIALAINFVACSDDNTDNAVVPTATVEKVSTFNPNPTPEDYKNVNSPNFRTTSSTAKVAGTTITYVKTYVPDSNFKDKLLNMGTDVAVDDANKSDSYILINPARAGLILEGSSINDLTGIQAFTSLQYLYLNGNNLTSLNLSGLTNLSYLDCRYNNLTSLNLSANTQLSKSKV